MSMSMSVQEREQFVLELMRDALDSYGFTNWTVKLTRGTRTLAWVNNTSCTMACSRYWAVILPDDMLMDLLLHEVAHAITREEYGRWPKPHGPEWKRIARSIGCTGLGRSIDRSRLPLGLTSKTVKQHYDRMKVGE